MPAGIDGHVEFDEGKGGQTIARLKHTCGSTAEVCAGKLLYRTSNLHHSCNPAAPLKWVIVGVSVWSQRCIVEAAWRGGCIVRQTRCSF